MFKVPKNFWRDMCSLYYIPENEHYNHYYLVNDPEAKSVKINGLRFWARPHIITVANNIYDKEGCMILGSDKTYHSVNIKSLPAKEFIKLLLYITLDKPVSRYQISRELTKEFITLKPSIVIGASIVLVNLGKPKDELMYIFDKYASIRCFTVYNFTSLLEFIDMLNNEELDQYDLFIVFNFRLNQEISISINDEPIKILRHKKSLPLLSKICENITFQRAFYLPRDYITTYQFTANFHVINSYDLYPATSTPSYDLLKHRKCGINARDKSRSLNILLDGYYIYKPIKILHKDEHNELSILNDVIFGINNDDEILKYNNLTLPLAIKQRFKHGLTKHKLAMLAYVDLNTRIKHNIDVVNDIHQKNIIGLSELKNDEVYDKDLDKLVTRIELEKKVRHNMESIYRNIEYSTTNVKHSIKDYELKQSKALTKYTNDLSNYDFNKPIDKSIKPILDKISNYYMMLPIKYQEAIDIVMSLYRPLNNDTNFDLGSAKYLMNDHFSNILEVYNNDVCSDEIYEDKIVSFDRNSYLNNNNQAVDGNRVYLLYNKNDVYNSMLIKYLSNNNVPFIDLRNQVVDFSELEISQDLSKVLVIINNLNNIGNLSEHNYVTDVILTNYNAKKELTKDFVHKLYIKDCCPPKIHILCKFNEVNHYINF